ncbi:putative set1/Ash2 histone methyltransferase complex subunit ASH2-like [Apostichopus japonicus]|uniref:Putative set1/Ash2 histone methyltransferase complex subunit ASH2-like n=1 Tax=Stichopus japonicus TaxID=307972 RepID=A0A2G8KX74_STIJA|nr:putative set1/Ash2 histone methyltransferase complex subunit ASH2-like [Apostichopus japonicus]
MDEPTEKADSELTSSLASDKKQEGTTTSTVHQQDQTLDTAGSETLIEKKPDSGKESPKEKVDQSNTEKPASEMEIDEPSDSQDNAAEQADTQVTFDPPGIAQTDLNQEESGGESLDSKETETVEIGPTGETASIEEDISMEITDGQEVELMDTSGIETASEETTTVTTETAVTEQRLGREEAVTEQSSTVEASEKGGKPTCCYCGRGRNLDVVELQCSICMKWFHKDCLSINLGNCIPFMMSYTFCCKRCNPNNVEMYSRKVPNFSVLCYVVLANLTAQSRKADPPKTMFSKDGDIIPFIDANWELLTPAQRRTTVTWHSTIVKAMMKDAEMFVFKEKPDNPDENDEEYPLFGLLDQDLSKIGPNYDPRGDATQKSGSLSSSLNGNSGLLMTNVGRGRGARKRGLDSSQNLGANKKTKGELSASLRVSQHGYPLEHPFNKDGYRYTLTENDPHAPAALFDEDIWIGKPIPAHLYRKALSTQVLLALHDRAPQLKISSDRLTVSGEKGYSMVRSTHGVRYGTWYFEVTINEMPENTATRIGWSQPLGNLQAPLGYDKFGYSWRSRKGTKFHQSRGTRYTDGYGEGDVLGCLILLPENIDKSRILPDTYKNRTLIKFKSHLYFEEKDEPTETEKSLKVTPGSKISFYKNGKNQGTAFSDIHDGLYYPCVSLYKSCSATVNFGPKFKHPPTDVGDYKPISDLAEISQVEQTLSDAIFHVEHEKMYEDAARGILVVF